MIETALVLLAGVALIAYARWRRPRQRSKHRQLFYCHKSVPPKHTWHENYECEC